MDTKFLDEMEKEGEREGEGGRENDEIKNLKEGSLKNVGEIRSSCCGSLLSEPDWHPWG